MVDVLDCIYPVLPSRSGVERAGLSFHFVPHPRQHERARMLDLQDRCATWTLERVAFAQGTNILYL